MLEKHYFKKRTVRRIRWGDSTVRFIMVRELTPGLFSKEELSLLK
jgi:hypothetical protein